MTRGTDGCSPNDEENDVHIGLRFVEPSVKVTQFMSLTFIILVFIRLQNFELRFVELSHVLCFVEASVQLINFLSHSRKKLRSHVPSAGTPVCLFTQTSDDQPQSRHKDV